MKTLPLVATLGLLMACGGAPPLPPPPVAPPPVSPPQPLTVVEPPRVTPDAPFRDHMPEPGPPVAFVPPKIESFALKNGVRVLLVERHDLPIVSVRVVVKAGAGDIAARPGVLAFMGSMLEQGAAKRTALELSDAFESIGASHAAWVDWDSGNASVRVTAGELEPALALLADVVTRPAFPTEEVERLKARRLSALKQEKSEPSSLWNNAAAAKLYGRAHPYGHPLGGLQDDVGKITQAEIVHAYHLVFVPERAAIVVAGDVTKDALAKKLEAAFGGWRGNGGGPVTVPKAPPASPDEPRVVVVDRPGAPQSMVRLAEVGVARLAPDRDAIVVMNAILGGMFSSHINLNLREAHAYTYGAHSNFGMRHGAGTFAAGGAMVADKTAPAIHELFVEVEGMRDKPVSDEELANAKQHAKLGLPGRFETVGEVTGALAELFTYGLPLDEYATLPARIDKVTVEDVQKAAKAHLHPGTIRVIVVGDRATLVPELEQLHLGAIETRDAYGDVVR